MVPIGKFEKLFGPKALRYAFGGGINNPYSDLAILHLDFVPIVQPFELFNTKPFLMRQKIQVSCEEGTGWKMNEDNIAVSINELASAVDHCLSGYITTHSTSSQQSRLRDRLPPIVS